MKKALSLCTLLFALTPALVAENSYDEIGYMSFKYGLTNLDDGFSPNQHTFAMDFIGEIGSQIKPKLDLSYVSVDDQYGVDSLFQTSINLYFKSQYGYQNIIPYFYGGFGYEYVSGAKSDFDSNFYLQEAAGIEIPISQPSDNLHIITELRLMQIVGSGNGQDDEMSLFVGLRLPIGNTFLNYGEAVTRYAEPTSPYPELQGDTISPSSEEFEESYTQPVIDKPVSSSNHNLLVDADGDGVADSYDICPNTPFETAVNKVGCPIKSNRLYIEKPRKTFRATRSKTSNFRTLPTLRKILDIHFELNSDKIAEESRVIIRKFVEAVNHTSSMITVEGYTDSTGRYEQNIALSQRRAEAVKELMIQYGVDSTRIKAVGKGSMSPIATNETELGRAQNRRIEIVVE